MYNTLKTKIKIFCIFKHPKKRIIKIDHCLKHLPFVFLAGWQCPSGSCQITLQVAPSQNFHILDIAKGSKVFRGPQCNSDEGGCSAKNAPSLSGRTRLEVEIELWRKSLSAHLGRNCQCVTCSKDGRFRLGRFSFLSKRICTLCMPVHYEQ